MGLVVNILLYALLLSSFGLFVWALFSAVLNTTHQGERRFRILLMMVGATIVLVSQSTGVSYADFIVASLGDIRPLTFGFLAVVAPAAAGGTLAWYLGRQAKKNEDLTARILALVGMLAAAQFITLFGVSISADGFSGNGAMIPNASFIVGFTLFSITLDRDLLTSFGGESGPEGRGSFASKRGR